MPIVYNAWTINIKWTITEKYLAYFVVHIWRFFFDYKCSKKEFTGSIFEMIDYSNGTICKINFSVMKTHKKKIRLCFYYMQNWLAPLKWKLKITEWLRLEGISAGHLVQPPTQAATSITDFPGKLLKISTQGDSTTSITHIVKECFLIFRWNFLYASLCPLPLALSLDTTGKSLTPSSLHPLFKYLYTMIRSPWTFYSSGWTSLSQSLPALLTSLRRRDAAVPW